MTVAPEFENRLAQIESVATAIQAVVDEARTDLDGYAHIPIDPMSAPLDRVQTKLAEADLDVFLPWLTAEVQRLVALRNS